MLKLSYGDLVSVVIPAYNHAKYIKEALDSVYQQTYPSIELIVLDDCSKDETLEIAQQWALETNADKRFIRVHIEKNAVNLGAHNTINKGLLLARGNALTILNSDDKYFPNRIETLMQAAEQKQVDWLFSGIRVIDDVGERVFSDLAIEIESMIDYAEAYPAMSFAFLKKNIAATTGNLFFSREIYQNVGEFQNLRYCHDWDFALQSCLISEPGWVTEPLYYYRIHGENAFSSLKVEKHLEPQIVYWRYFAACHAGNCKNPNALTPNDWPGFFEKWIADDFGLNWVISVVGDNSVKYDRLMQAVNFSVNA